MTRKHFRWIGMGAGLLALTFMAGPTFADSGAHKHKDRHPDKVVVVKHDRGGHRGHYKKHDRHDHRDARFGVKFKIGDATIAFGKGAYRDRYRHGYHGRHGYQDRCDVRPVYRPQRIWVPGHFERRWAPPVTRTERRPCGTLVTITVRPGYYDRVWVPGHWELRRRH